MAEWLQSLVEITGPCSWLCCFELKTSGSLGHVLFIRPYSICRIWIQIHSESGFGFTSKSNGLDSWCCQKWRHCCSFTFVILMLLPVSLVRPRESWIRYIHESVFGFVHWMDGFTEPEKSESESGFGFVKLNAAIAGQSNSSFKLSWKLGFRLGLLLGFVPGFKLGLKSNLDLSTDVK